MTMFSDPGIIPRKPIIRQMLLASNYAESHVTNDINKILDNTSN